MAVILASPDELECGVCGRPITPGEPTEQDVELLTCHAACLVGSLVVDFGTFAPNQPGETSRG